MIITIIRVVVTRYYPLILPCLIIQRHRLFIPYYTTHSLLFFRFFVECNMNIFLIKFSSHEQHLHFSPHARNPFTFFLNYKAGLQLIR